MTLHIASMREKILRSDLAWLGEEMVFLERMRGACPEHGHADQLIAIRIAGVSERIAMMKSLLSKVTSPELAAG